MAGSRPVTEAKKIMEPHRLKETLRRRTEKLVIAKRRLREGILLRKGAEAALRKSVARHALLLRQSLLLQNGLRQLAGQAIAESEAERGRISWTLQNDIAQALVAIHVRLLLLKRETFGNARDLRNQIGDTQQLVSGSKGLMAHLGALWKS